jgi:hypothetical protein
MGRNSTLEKLEERLPRPRRPFGLASSEKVDSLDNSGHQIARTPRLFTGKSTTRNANEIWDLKDVLEKRQMSLHIR